MSQAPRSTTIFPTGSAGTSLRQSNYPVAQQSSVLAARIASKKAELDDLRELRDLSGVLAAQMQALEEKLSTLKDGTEGKNSIRCHSYAHSLTCILTRFTAVACVLANWDNVLRAISMASCEYSFQFQSDGHSSRVRFPLVLGRGIYGGFPT